jgi:ABC-type Fe3+ transport system permease subunit
LLEIEHPMNAELPVDTESMPPERRQRIRASDLAVDALEGRVRQGRMKGWLKTARMTAVTFAICIVVVAVVAVLLASLVEGHPVDAWLLGEVRVVRSTLQSALSGLLDDLSLLIATVLPGWSFGVG